MARGWESKGAEEQAGERERAAALPRAGHTTGPAEELRLRQELELQREQILNSRTSNPHRRAALTAALAQVDAQLAALEV